MNKRGSMFLLWTLTFSATVLVLVIGYFPMFQAAVATSARTFRAEQSLALAEVGANLGVWQVSARNGGDLPTSEADQTGNTPPWVDPSPDMSACTNLDGGSNNQLYGVTVFSCFHTDPVSIFAQDNFGGEIGTYQAYIINFGAPEVLVVGRSELGGSTDTAVGERKVVVRLERKDAGDAGLFSKWGIRLDGSAPVYVDSYNSSAGAYNPAAPGSEGNIGTNGDNPNGWEADIIVSHAGTVIKGRGELTAGDNYSSAAAPPIGGWNMVADTVLPSIVVPSSLTSLPLTTNLVGAGIIQNGQGDFQITGTYTCDAPMRIRSLFINNGTFNIGDGCQLFFDGKNADGTNHNPAYKPGGAALDADASGKLLKIGTGTTKIFMRDLHFALDGKGISYDASVPEASRKPEQLQMYTSCTTKGACDTTSAFAQTSPFYGIVYVEDGHLSLVRGSENGWSYDTQYHGLFASEKFIFATGENRNQYGLPDDYSPYLHIDRALKDFWLDGSGRKGYHVRPGAWSVK